MFRSKISKTRRRAYGKSDFLAYFDVVLAIQRTHGKVIKRVHEDVIGRLPTSREQELLKTVRNAPVLEVQRTNYAADDDKTVIMFNRFIFVASYFVLSYDYVTPLSLMPSACFQGILGSDERSVKHLDA